MVNLKWDTLCMSKYGDICLDMTEKSFFELLQQTTTRPDKLIGIWYVFDMKIWKVFGMQFDQTPIKNLHIPEVFDRSLTNIPIELV
jgi:hypothetical protein